MQTIRPILGQKYTLLAFEGFLRKSKNSYFILRNHPSLASLAVASENSVKNYARSSGQYDAPYPAYHHFEMRSSKKKEKDRLVVQGCSQGDFSRYTNKISEKKRQKSSFSLVRA